MMLYRSCTKSAFVRLYFVVFISLFFSPSFASGSKPTLPLCSSAVSQTQQYIQANRQLAAARFNANAMTSDAYQQLIIELDDAETSVTMPKCMASNGVVFELFQCLASSKGNYAACR